MRLSRWAINLAIMVQEFARDLKVFFFKSPLKKCFEMNLCIPLHFFLHKFFFVNLL